MKFLFAPWRIKYILGLKEKNCVFCRMNSEQKDQQNYILRRNKHSFVVLNLFPYTTGHLMVVPYSHCSRLSDLDAAASMEIMEELKFWSNRVDAILHSEGCNIGINMGRAAGAGIADHIHFHVVPRWLGDENFMAVVGETKVLPDSLASIYSKLKV
jgi:ATP adenylyltransferase